jgi:hypothetical protein
VETILINSFVVLISVYFGFYLNERTRTKKDKEEAKQMFNILQDEIKSNLDNNLNKDFSSEYLSVLGEEVLKAKMGILAEHHKDSLNYFVKIYRQFININKALSDSNNSNMIATSTTLSVYLPKIEARKEITRLRKLCKADILRYFNKRS